MRTVKVSQQDLADAATEGLLSHKDTAALWQFFKDRPHNQEVPEPTTPKFDLAHLSWYSGAAIVMAAMAWVMGQVWDSFNGAGVTVTSLIYTLAFLVVGSFLWRRKDLKVPGGVLFTLAVSMTPLTIFGIERVTGFLDHHQNQHLAVLFVTGGTIAAALAALRFIRFPFITAPAAVASWFLAIDVSEWVFGNALNFQEQMGLMMGFGALMIVGSFIVDRLSKEDFAYWGYLFGTIGMWFAMTALIFDQGSENLNALYALANVGLMLLSVLLNRRIFVVVGSLGVAGYIAHLSWVVFANSWLFPIALSMIGLSVIYLGVKYHRNREAIENAILGMVPSSLQSWLPKR